MPSTGALAGLRRRPSWLGNAVRSGGGSLSVASAEPGCGVQAALWRVLLRGQQLVTRGDERRQHEVYLLCLRSGGQSLPGLGQVTRDAGDDVVVVGVEPRWTAENAFVFRRRPGDTVSLLDEVPNGYVGDVDFGG